MAKTDPEVKTTSPELAPAPAGDGKRTHEEWFEAKGSKIEQGAMVYAMAKIQHDWAIGLRMTESAFDEGIKRSAEHPFGDRAKAQSF